MEAAAKQILDTLNLFDTMKNQATLTELESNTNVFVNLFPKSMAHQNYVERRYKEIDNYLYGQIVDKILSAVDNYSTVNDTLLFIMNKIMTIEYISFPMFFELITIIDIHFKKSIKHTTTDLIILTLKEIMKSNALYSAIVDICSNDGRTVEKHDTSEQRWKKFLQLLVSLPCILANKTKGKESEDCFQVDTYSKLLIYHVSRALCFLNDERRQFYIKPNFGIISSIISKCIFAFGSYRFVDLIYILQNWSLNSQKNMQSIIRNILYHIERNSVESTAVLFLKSIKNSWEVSKIFGNLINVPQWKHVLTTKIPLLSYYANDNLIINLISYLFYFQSKQDILIHLLFKLLNIWRNKRALNHISIDQHEYIAKLIIISVIKLKNHLNQVDQNKIKKLLFDGTFFHLTSLNIQVRAIGMITSELVVLNLKDSENSPELKYDYDMLSDIGKNIITRIGNFSNNISRECLPKNNSISSIKINIDDGDKKIFELGVHCCILLNNTGYIRTFEISNNNQISSKKIMCKQIKEKENVVCERKHNYDDIDSDDDLIQYDISSEKKITENIKPTYLRDLKDNIINSSVNNNSDIFSESLQIAEDLILSQLPNDDPSFAIELLNILLMVKENIYVKNFRMLKLKACIAIVIVYPKQCAKFLCDQFHSESKEITISDRLLFLEILAEAAKKLSKIEIYHNERKKLTSKTVKIHKAYSKSLSLLIDMCGSKKHEILYDDEYEVSIMYNSSAENWKEIIEERIRLNTRRIAQETKNFERTINKFNEVASYFFYPLLYGMTQNHTYIYKVPDDLADIKNILLLNFLDTLSILMIAAENCVIAPRMALDILELAWSLRYHEEANIRLIIIKSVAIVIVTLSNNNFTNEILALLFEFRTWLADMSLNSVKGDPDINCRRLGENVMSLIDSIVVSSIKLY